MSGRGRFEDLFVAGLALAALAGAIALALTGTLR